jgi:hypothetical protein
MKKAQLLSQPFTYIFMLIVIAMIVGFGFYLITKTTIFAGQVDVAKFKNDLSKKVQEINLLSPGSGELYETNVPAGIRGICFLDLTKDSNIASKISFVDVKEDVELDLTAEKKDNNVYFQMATADQAKISPVKISKLKIAENPLCFTITGGKLKVGLENKGKYVQVSR